MIGTSKRIFAAAALVLGVAGIASTASARSEAAASKAVGPAIGSRIAMSAPLIDSSGHPTALAAVSHGKPVMLVLFRSAAWCPYCQRQLKGLGPVAEAARHKGIVFLAASYDKPQVLADFASKQNIRYPLYSDPQNKMVSAMGLRDPQYKKGSIAYGVPYPTTLLVDTHGRVKGKLVESDYRIRPTSTDLIAMMDQL